MFFVRQLRNIKKINESKVVLVNKLLITRQLRGRARPTIETHKIIAEGRLDEPGLESVKQLQESAHNRWLDANLPPAPNLPSHPDHNNDSLPSKKWNSFPKTVQQQKQKNLDKALSIVEKENQLPSGFNLAAYVEKSPTLQQLVRLGVDLNSIERRKGLGEFVLRLDFDKDITPYLLFLQDHGVDADKFGEIITRNPLLFKVDMDDAHTRINYLQAKNFNQTQITRILALNPYWLMFSTRRLDTRLGYFQKEFKLSGNDVRFLAAKLPRLITYNMEHIRKSTFCIREEMGFQAEELKCLLLSKPRLWMLKSDELIERFAYAHQEMGLSHQMLLQFPEVLTSREFRLRQRHGFLKLLGRAQYQPEKDLYISPKALVEGTDYQFVRHVAKSDMKTYELFLKTN